jgi:hypothetical protein
VYVQTLVLLSIFSVVLVVAASIGGTVYYVKHGKSNDSNMGIAEQDAAPTCPTSDLDCPQDDDDSYVSNAFSDLNDTSLLEPDDPNSYILNAAGEKVLYDLKYDSPIPSKGLFIYNYDYTM